MADISSLISLAAVGISGSTLLYNWRTNAGRNGKAIWDAIESNTSEIAVIKKQTELFWSLVEQQMAKALIRPTHIELDNLLEKLVKRIKLTSDEESRLQTILKDTIHDKEEVAGIRAMAATILAIRLGKQELRRRL